MTRQERDLERWLASNVRQQPLAVILGSAWNGLSFARSLGRRGIPVLVLEGGRNLGSYTRYGKVLTLPPVDDDPEAWIRVLRFVSERLTDPGVLLPMGDGHMLFVSRYEEVLRAGFRFVVPPGEAVEQIVNKRLQYAVAREAGVPTPGIWFPESADHVRELSAELPFPCLLKPYTSHIAKKALGQKVIVARSAGELIAGYQRVAAHDVPVMVQEVVEGDDPTLLGYLAIWDREGRELAWVTKHKLRQNPPGFGDGAVQITAEAPEVADLSRRLLRAFDYRGFVGVEWKLDIATGVLKLMEINPRTVAGNQMAIDGGVDFPWIGYRYLTGSDGDAEHTRGFRPGVKHVNEELDTKSYLALRRSHGMTVGQWARSLRGTTSWAIWARDDPLPFVILVFRLLRLVAATAFVVTGRALAARGFRRHARLGSRRA
jgi:predicted ATP-grasp superfamily ATP-dependent carboligase